jgi:hypothetical protein
MVAVLLPVLAVGCGGVDRGAYVNANERLVAALPSFPGSKLRSETSTPYYQSEVSPPAGYTTLVDLKLPKTATTAIVSDFFRKRLHPPWQLVETLDGRIFNFRRGKSFISVNLMNEPRHSLEIDVDHAYYGKLGR